MTDRRYSIIPARAVTDDRIERGDLRVLAYLGTFTDKLGWCFLAQGTIAEALDCGRSTVQRALARLIEAGWVQTKEFNGPRPHACHAYRVIMDTDDQNLDPPESAVGEEEQDDRCPQVGTSTLEVLHPCTPVPVLERAPPPSEVPTHTRAHKDQDSEVHVGGSARTREAPMISEQAHTVATEIATIAGHDPKFLPPGWMSDGPAMRVQMMLDHGWQRTMMVETARAVMVGKRDGPPTTIRYFEKPFAKAHAKQSTPTQLPNAPAPSEKNHADATRRQPAEGWQESRDNWRRAATEFGAAVDAIDGSPNPRSQGGA